MQGYVSLLLLTSLFSSSSSLLCYHCEKWTVNVSLIYAESTDCLNADTARPCFKGGVCVEGNSVHKYNVPQADEHVHVYYKGCDHTCAQRRADKELYSEIRCNERVCDTDLCNDMTMEQATLYRGIDEDENNGEEIEVKDNEGDLVNKGEVVDDNVSKRQDTDEQVDDEQVDDEQVDDEQVDDEQVDDEQVDDDQVDDKQADVEQVDDEQVDDEQVDDEQVDDEQEDDSEDEVIDDNAKYNVREILEEGSVSEVSDKNCATSAVLITPVFLQTVVVLFI